MDPADRRLIARHATRGRRIDRMVGRGFYISSAAFSFTTAAAYLPPLGHLPRQLEIIGEIMPPDLWVILWVIAGVLLIIAMWSRRVGRVAIPLFAALMASMAGAYFVEQVAEDEVRAWVSMKNYAYLWVTCLVAAYFTTNLLPHRHRRGDHD